MADGANRPAYNSTWQIRNDAWCSLEETSGQLLLAGAQHRPVGELDEAVHKLLDVLGPIERFWAFPGTPAFQKLRRLFTAGKYDRFAALVRGINRALATDSYRSGHSWDLGAEDDALDHASHPMEHGRADRPYFEVLVVEDMTEHQERALREELRRWRRPDDPFIYEIVVVPSLEDAIMAARLNFGLQACVVRRRFARRSRYDSSSLAQFIDSIVADDVMEQSPDDRAQILARALARLRPELDLYLMTEIAIEDLAGRLSHHFRRIFHAREGSLELHLSILDGVAARYRDAVLQRAEELQPPADRGVPRAADLAGQVDRRTRTGSRTWSTSTAWRSSWPRPPRPAAGSTRCSSRPARCGTRSSSRRGPSARGRPTSSPTAPRPPTRSSSRRWCSPATSCWSTGTATSRTTTG